MHYIRETLLESRGLISWRNPFVGTVPIPRKILLNSTFLTFEITFSGNVMLMMRQRIVYSELVGLLTYLDWAMVFFTALSCYSMLFESPWPTTGENMIFNNPYLQVALYVKFGALKLKLLNQLVIFFRSVSICSSYRWPLNLLSKYSQMGSFLRQTL